jgi:hypothetical protein
MEQGEDSSSAIINPNQKFSFKSEKINKNLKQKNEISLSQFLQEETET